MMLAVSAMAGPPPLLPNGPLPDGLGVNIHFTSPQTGEMKMLAEGGFTWVRMDYDWNRVEYEKGKYRFDDYEVLMKALEEYRIRPIFILDYVHRLYDDAQSPHSDEAIAAFARFAAASAKHFAGRGILWEMYNEPNITFWRPTVNVTDYIRLATATGKAIRAAAPKEAYIGPATSGLDWNFLEACFKAGLLQLWDAVSVHPYRSMPPETVIPDFARLRALIRKYAPKGKRVPIISGEWGYSSVWGGMDPDKQAKMLCRQWLTNMACDVPLSIWYDWHDDGPDPKEPEHHFGTTLNPTFAGRDPIYDPKPAYFAARTLTRILKGLRFNKRLVAGNPTVHLLLFSRGREVRIAAWTTETGGVDVTIPVSPGPFEVTDHLGKTLDRVTAQGDGLKIRLGDAPIYLQPLRANAALETAAAWERLPQEVVTPYKPQIVVSAAVRGSKDVTTVTKTVALDRSETPVPVRLELRLRNAAPIVQETRVVVSDPLIVSLGPPMAGQVKLAVSNPSGKAFSGRLVLTGRGSETVKQVIAVRLRAGESRSELLARAPRMAAGGVTLDAAIHDTQGRQVVTVGPQRYIAVDEFSTSAESSGSLGYVVMPDGDPKVASTQSVSVAAPADGPPAPGIGCLRLTYQFAQGWKFVQIRFTDASRNRIEGKPAALGVWIHGDGKGNIPRLRFVDASGQTWQPDGEPITWTGWKWVTFPLDGSRSGRWGGADDGVIHYPICWDALFLLDSAGRRESEGVIHIAAPTLIY
jgi:hypothetical protein